MKHLYFRNGDAMPSIGLGTWQSKPNEVFDAVLHAIEAGYRHLDCAYIYENEAEIGLAIKQAIKDNLVKREELFITTKLWNSEHDPLRVEKAIQNSLKDLQLDYVDLYLMHWPIAFKPGVKFSKTPSDLLSLHEMPLSSTWEAMIQLKEKGLTKHVGTSNFNINKMNLLKYETGVLPELNQVEMHPFFQQNTLLQYCTDNIILSTAYSPLGSRHLIHTPESVTETQIIQEIAAAHQCAPTQVVLAWGMQRKTAVIPKSTNRERIFSNFKATDIVLSLIEMQKIATLERNQRMSKGAHAVMEGGCYTQESIWTH